MTKHIVGLILFTFIVGTSAIIAGLFYEVPKANSIKVKKNYYYTYKKKKKKKRCRKYRRSSAEIVSVNLSQAIFDSSANRLTAKIKYEDSWDSSGVVNLHFFVKDKYGTRFLKTERLYASTAMDKYTKILDWMGRLDSRENLYVIPQVQSDNYDITGYPKFNQFKATPILLKAGN